MTSLVELHRRVGYQSVECKSALEVSRPHNCTVGHLARTAVDGHLPMSTARILRTSTPEVPMSTDSSFDDKPLEDDPRAAESDPDVDLDNPLRDDPLARPDVIPRKHEEKWNEPSEGDGIPGDKDMPLPND